VQMYQPRHDCDDCDNSDDDTDNDEEFDTGLNLFKVDSTRSREYYSSICYNLEMSSSTFLPEINEKHFKK